MKTVLFCIIFLLSSQLLAGEKFKAGEEVVVQKVNGSTFHLGSIHKSLLTESQFQAQAGACWVIIQGQSIVGTDLAALTGDTNLPDARGRFLRTVGGNSASLGQTQEDEFSSHRHDSYSTSRNTGTTSTRIPRASDGVNPSTSLVTGYFGGNETRPVNLTVNAFIKVNNDCN